MHVPPLSRAEQLSTWLSWQFTEFSSETIMGEVVSTGEMIFALHSDQVKCHDRSLDKQKATVRGHHPKPVSPSFLLLSGTATYGNFAATMWDLNRDGRQNCSHTGNLESFGQLSAISTNFPLKWVLKTNFLLVALLFSLPIHFFPLNFTTLEKAHILLLASHTSLRLRADSLGMKPWMFVSHMSPLDSEVGTFVLRSVACFPVCFKHTGSISCHLSMTTFDNVSLLDEICPLDFTAASLFFPQCLTIFHVCSLSYSSGRQKKSQVSV